MKDGNFWIVITEDQEKDSQRLSSFIRRYGKENGLTIEITEFTDGAQLLEHYDKRFDILFMDIGLPQISGMELDRLEPFLRSRLFAESGRTA